MGSKPTAEAIRVEVAYATPDEQVILELEVSAGSTVEEVLEASRLYEKFPDANLRSATVGVWGQVTERSSPVADGDRIELYRPLSMDPRDARRLRAKGGD